METVKTKAHIGSDGLLRLELPINIANREVEIVIVVQPEPETVDSLGWPVGFFEETYGSQADDPIARGI